MADNKYISVKICGNPDANGGFMPLITFNSPTFDVRDTVYSGFHLSSYFFSVKIEPTQVVYKLIKNNVSSYGASRQGALIIAIAVPSGFKIAGYSPFDALIILKERFLASCMTCLDPQMEKYQFNKGLINPNILNDVAQGFNLVAHKGPHRPMLPNGAIGYVTMPESQMGMFMSDVQYPAFASFSEILVAESAQPAGYSLVNIQVPRLPEYRIFEDGRQTRIVTNQSEELTFAGVKRPEFYDNRTIRFSIEQLKNGEIVVPEATLDIANETVTVKTSSLSKAKERTISIEFDSNEVSNYFYMKPDFFALSYDSGLGSETITVGRDFKATFRGEEIAWIPKLKPICFSREKYIVASCNLVGDTLKVHTKPAPKRTINQIYSDDTVTATNAKRSDIVEVKLSFTSADNPNFRKPPIEITVCVCNTEKTPLQTTKMRLERDSQGRFSDSLYIPEKWFSRGVSLSFQHENCDYFMSDWPTRPDAKTGVCELKYSDFEITPQSFFRRIIKSNGSIVTLLLGLLLGLLIGGGIVCLYCHNKQLAFMESTIDSFRCDQCDQSFATRAELALHKNSEHSRSTTPTTPEPEEGEMHPEETDGGAGLGAGAAAAGATGAETEAESQTSADSESEAEENATPESEPESETKKQPQQHKYTCNICGPDMYFKTKQELINHKFNKHFICRKCNKQCNSEREVKRHEQGCGEAPTLK